MNRCGALGHSGGRPEGPVAVDTRSCAFFVRRRCQRVAIIDISPTLHAGIGVWPGDVPFEMEKTSDIEQGAHLDLGAIRTTLHVGAHTDAHRHYVPHGADAASMPLEAYYGPCQVIDVQAQHGHRFGWKQLATEPTAPRVLLRTRTFKGHDTWNTDFAAPEPELIDQLADLDVRLVGFDTPSTDLFSSKDLAAHKRLAARDVANLEGLALDHVEAGQYTLIALPLRLEGADASPVRAVLVT